MIGDKATLYHSALVAATKDGPVEFDITCDGPQPSKFNKDQDVIFLEHEGFKHTYNVENQECGEALTGLRGQTVWIEASGRSDKATIYVTDENGDPLTGEQPRQQPRPPARQQQRQQAPPSRQQTPPRQQHAPARHEKPAPHRLTPEERAEKELLAFRSMKVHGARVAVAMEASFRFAEKLLLDLGHATQDTDGAGAIVLAENVAFEDLRAIAISHFIEVRGTTDMKSLPLKWIDTTAKPEPPPRQQPRREPSPRQREEEQAPEDRRAGNAGAPEPVYDENGESETDLPF